MAKLSPWSVKSVDPEAREAAKIAARRAGLTLGAWLNRTILGQAAAELGGESRAAGGRDRESGDYGAANLPAIPTEQLIEAIELLREEVRDQRDEISARVARQHRRVAEETLRPLSDSLAALNEKIDGIDVGGVGDEVGEQIEEIAERADRAALSVAPLERQMVRLMERIEREDDPRRNRRPGRRRGVLARLFGDD